MGCWRQWGAGGSGVLAAVFMLLDHSRAVLSLSAAPTQGPSSRSIGPGGTALARELEAGCARAVLWALPCSCGGGCVLARELEAGCARAVCSPRGAGAVSAALAVGPAAG